MSKIKPCALGPKHTWFWKRNVTLKRLKVTPRGATVHLSRRGDYRCECGEQKYGAAKSEPLEICSTPEEVAAATA